MTEPTDALDVVWVNQPIIKMHDNPPPESQWEYRVWLPDWLAEWDVFGDWEVERFNSMRDNLEKGDILFDIGTELAWQSIIYARFVEPQNVVLIEPANVMWPNIRETWQHNFPGVPPLACYAGLMGADTTHTPVLQKNTWPSSAVGDLVHHVSYKYIHEHSQVMDQITVDEYCERTGITPDAMTMDIEGGELLVLHGAEKTLRSNNIKVWVSIHEELGKLNYGFTPKDIHRFMKKCGYKGKYLATDHEEHWYFTKVAL